VKLSNIQSLKLIEQHRKGNRKKKGITQKRVLRAFSKTFSLKKGFVRTKPME